MFAPSPGWDIVPRYLREHTFACSHTVHALFERCFSDWQVCSRMFRCFVRLALWCSFGALDVSTPVLSPAVPQALNKHIENSFLRVTNPGLRRLQLFAMPAPFSCLGIPGCGKLRCSDTFLFRTGTGQNLSLAGLPRSRTEMQP